MQDREWKEILNGINFQGFSHENVIDRIKERLLASEHQDAHNAYRKWEGSDFNVNYSFAFQSEHTNGECTLLHLAASYGLKDVVKALLKIGAEVNTTDQDDATPLHWAAISGNADVVASLLKNGADPSLKNKDGKTPINLAQDNNIKQLLRGAKKRYFLEPTTISIIAGLTVALEVIMAVWHTTQDNIHSVTMPIMLIFTTIMVTILAAIDCALTHAAFVLDNDGLSTEISETQVEERPGIEVSAV